MSRPATADRSRTVFLVLTSAAAVLAIWLTIASDPPSLSDKPGVDGNLQTIISVQRYPNGDIESVGSAGPTITIHQGEPGWSPPPTTAPASGYSAAGSPQRLSP